MAHVYLDQILVSKYLLLLRYIYRTMLLGKVLRIDVDNYVPGITSYSIPQDNPFNNYGPLPDGTYPLPEIYAYGVRNIWRCGIDKGDPNIKGSVHNVHRFFDR